MVVFLMLINYVLGVARPEEVLRLDNSNFEETVASNRFLLVYFYGPYCGVCNKVQSEFERAATLLKKHNPQIKLADLDISVNKDLAHNLDIKDIPTLKFFKDGQMINYTGGRTKKNIYDWMVKNIENPATFVDSVDQMKETISGNKVVVILFGGSPEQIQAFERNSIEISSPVFIYTNSTKIYEEFEVSPPAIFMFKTFDDKKNEFQGEFTYEEIKEFVEVNRVPWVMTLDEEGTAYIMDELHSCLLFFRAESEHKKYIDMLTVIAKRYKKYLCLVTGDAAINNKVAVYLGISAKDQPLAAIVDPPKTLKYILKDEPTQLNLKKFIDNWKEGILEPTLKSSPVPKFPYDESVRTLVGTNFHEVVEDRRKDVFVLFCAAWNYVCNAFEPMYKSIAKSMSHVEGLVFAKIDMAENELLGFVNVKFPTLMFYGSDRKEGVEYDGSLEEQSLLNFVQSLKQPQAQARDDL